MKKDILKKFSCFLGKLSQLIFVRAKNSISIRNRGVENFKQKYLKGG